jgi:hypothetical protein
MQQSCTYGSVRGAPGEPASLPRQTDTVTFSAPHRPVLRPGDYPEAGVTGTIEKINRLTLGTPVRLPGVVLLPGEYAFESGARGTHPGIVRVTSADNQKVYYQGFTQAVQRPWDDREMVLAFGEAPVGAPKPIAAWFPLGSRIGHRFIYR